MKKNIFLSVFILFIAAFLLSACGSSGPAVSADADSTPVSVSPVIPDSPTVEDTAAPQSSSLPAEAEELAAAEQVPAPISLTLWCVEGEASGLLSDWLADHASEFSVTVQTFGSPASLLDSTSEGLPDIIFCSGLSLAQLGLSSSDFYTIGYDIPVLLVDDAALQSAGYSTQWISGISFEQLCSIAANSEYPDFLAAESFADVIENVMLACGESLSGDSSENRTNPLFISVYNMLAECAYSYTLNFTLTYPAELDAGSTACMFAASSTAMSMDRSGITVLPFPQPEASDSTLAAIPCGFAVMSSEENAAAAQLLTQLLNDTSFCNEAALAAGLVPLGSADAGDDPLRVQLAGIASSYSLTSPENGSYYLIRDELDAECRSAFADFD